MSITIKLADLTVGDLDTIEELSGATIAQIHEGELRARTVAALIFVDQRRTNPEYTFEDALSVRLNDVDIDARPTKARRASST